MSHCFSSNLIFEDVDISFLLPLCYLLFIISSSWVACRPIASLDLANLIPTILILQTYFSYLNMPILSSTHLPTLSSNCSMVLLSTHLILPIPTFDFVAIPHPPIPMFMKSSRYIRGYTCKGGKFYWWNKKKHWSQPLKFHIGEILTFAGVRWFWVCAWTHRGSFVVVHFFQF